MLSELRHFGGVLGFDGKGTFLMHPRLGRVYAVGPTNASTGHLPNATKCQLGTRFVVVALIAGVDVWTYNAGSLIAAPAINTATILTLKTNATTSGTWTAQTYSLNSVNTVVGVGTRTDTLQNVITANARPTITVDPCTNWSLTQCSGPSIGSVLYSKQNWTAYSGKSVHLSSDPTGVYRQVEPVVTLTGALDTRNLLALVDEGPFDTCGDNPENPCLLDPAPLTADSLIVSGVTGSSPCTSYNQTCDWNAIVEIEDTLCHLVWNKLVGGGISNVIVAYIVNGHWNTDVLLQNSGSTLLTLEPGKAALAVYPSSTVLTRSQFVMDWDAVPNLWLELADTLLWSNATEQMAGTQVLSSVVGGCGDATITVAP